MYYSAKTHLRSAEKDYKILKHLQFNLPWVHSVHANGETLMMEKENHEKQSEKNMCSISLYLRFGFIQRRLNNVRLEHGAVYVQMDQEALWQLDQLGEQFCFSPESEELKQAWHIIG